LAIGVHLWPYLFGLVAMKYALIAMFCTLSASAYAAPALCLNDEQDIFSCHTATKKIISVCASKDLAPDHGYLQYRFGLPDKVEVAVPADRSVSPANSALSGTLVFSGGGGDYLRFKAGDYDYVVYTAIGKGWERKTASPLRRMANSLVMFPARMSRSRISGLIFLARLV
jgi:hypothetical protein